MEKLTLKANTPIDRFLANTHLRGTGCWAWEGSLTSHGYGQISINGKMWKAHRLAYVLRYGEIPEGQCVLHACDNRKCVNPEHLHLGTRGDNNREAKERGRNARGIRHGSAKLTESQVARARNGPSAWGHYRTLAEEFGVTTHTVWRVATGRTWCGVSKKGVTTCPQNN